MRITPSTLRRIARDTVNRRVRASRDMLAVYLHGSLLGEDPVLAGTADIDLVFVHNLAVEVPREIEPLTDEVHLDMVHHTRRTYRGGRELRLDPTMGPAVYACKILYDPHHFLDFTQASVRGHYHSPGNILTRAQRRLEGARQVWLDLYRGDSAGEGEGAAAYLGAVADAANAIASLSGPPRPERRLLAGFPERAAAVGRPGLYLGVLGLLGGGGQDGVAQALYPAWEAAVQAAGERDDCPAALDPVRFPYYQRPLAEWLAGESPEAGLFLMLHTGTLAVEHLPAKAPQGAAWREALHALGLQGEAFPERVAALDVFLDTVEESLEEWGRAQGA